MPRPSLPVAPPLEGNDQLVTAVITGGWVIALVVLLLVRHHLAAADRWWIWVAVAGVSIGVFGLAYVPYLKRSRARAARRRAGVPPDDQIAG
jgi:Protein of unknown function (DUF2530)